MAAEREQYQPTPLEKVFAIVKSLLMRGMIIYFVMTMFRRPTPSTAPGSPADGTVAGAKTVASNLFQNGTMMDLYIYVNEQEEFGAFNDSEALIWTKKDLMYGDWYSGENGDATYSHSTQLKATEVRCLPAAAQIWSVPRMRNGCYVVRVFGEHPPRARPTDLV